jgi:hypothetical protein
VNNNNNHHHVEFEIFTGMDMKCFAFGYVAACSALQVRLQLFKNNISHQNLKNIPCKNNEEAGIAFTAD